MKKLLVKGILVLGILGVAAVATNLDDLAGYPPLHSPQIQEIELAGGFTTLGYPPLH
ncbi:hypothetical protein ACE38V_20525 [Cytobacillus sp. Hz8]|uniref:hypothetical protein n=1 Tax=Cytobacillus sp. Hz8 TaxID=3347168 RepID=UPI0035E12CBE